MRVNRKIYEIGDLEGDRRSTGKSPISSQKNKESIPDPEVSSTGKKRTFSTKYKIRILREVDESTHPGQKGAILRREGLYSSNITHWRKQMNQGKFSKKKNTGYPEKIAELSKQNRKLQRELNRTKLIIDAQKKILQILETTDQS